MRKEDERIGNEKTKDKGSRTRTKDEDEDEVRAVGSQIRVRGAMRLSETTTEGTESRVFRDFRG